MKEKKKKTLVLHALALQHPETPAVILHALGTSASHKLTKNNNTNNKIQSVHIFSVLAHVSLSFLSKLELVEKPHLWCFP